MNKDIEFIGSCSTENFEFANASIVTLLSTNFMLASEIYNRIIVELRKQKGVSRLRHLSFFNNYIICQGRFGRKDAI